LPYFGTTSNPGNAYAIYVTNTSGAGMYVSSHCTTGIRGPGINAYSDTGNGIQGVTDDLSGTLMAGVWGAGSRDGTIGVRGSVGYAGSIGVQGEADSQIAVGVKGISTEGYPIVGSVEGYNAISFAPAVLGSGTNGPGILGMSTNAQGGQGQSPVSHGLIGTTSATDGHAGLVGNADKVGGVGLIAIAPGYGTQTVGTAGAFYGNVEVHGTLTAPTQGITVKHQGDSTYRLLQSVASPDG
jgi:hypothetical protein